MKQSDESIIKQCLEGDGNAFSLLVEKYQNAVYGLCYHTVGNFADAQDLTQETFVKAYLELAQIRDYSKFARWLYRITVNVCKMWLRAKKDIDDLPLDAISHDEEIFLSSANLLQEGAEVEELHLSIKKAIDSLSERNRLVVTMYYIDGLSYEEIGNFLSLSESTIKSRLHRARIQLKEELITMVEDSFDKHKLPEDFSEKVVQEVIVNSVRLGEGKPPLVCLREQDGELAVLFDIENEQWHEELDNSKIPEVLQQKFRDKNMPLSGNASVSVKLSGNHWQITDGQKLYHIQKVGGNPTAVVLLQSKADKNQILPIWIGHFEAIAIMMQMENKAIIMQMENRSLPRPMTYDLMMNILKEVNTRILRIVITDLKEDTYYARITIESDGSLKEIDARPSDAIALALRANAPIFVAKSVLSGSGVKKEDV